MQHIPENRFSNHFAGGYKWELLLMRGKQYVGLVCLFIFH